MKPRMWTRVGEAKDLTPSYYGKKLVRVDYIDPNGTRRDFCHISFKNGAVALVVTTEGKVLVVREYKQGQHAVVVNLIGGVANLGELPEDVVRREMLEEAGYAPGRLIDLGVVFVEPRHAMGGCFTLFLALDCVKVQEYQQLDHGEEAEVEIEVIEFPSFEAWLDYVEQPSTRDGSQGTSDGFSGTATLRAQRWLRNHRPDLL